MDRYSSSDSPPSRCNSPICISIRWSPSVGSSRSRNRARIRTTNQAAAASSAKRPNQANQLAWNNLASSSRFPCPTWSASPARDPAKEPLPSPLRHYLMARRLRQGALRFIDRLLMQKASHSETIACKSAPFLSSSAGVAENQYKGAPRVVSLCSRVHGKRLCGPTRVLIRPVRTRRARRFLQGTIAIVASFDRLRQLPVSRSRHRDDVRTALVEIWVRLF